MTNFTTYGNKLSLGVLAEHYTHFWSYLCFTSCSYTIWHSSLFRAL